MAGLYKILEKAGHSFKVKLPELMKIYFVFSLDRLWKATDDPLPRQYNDSLLPIQIVKDEEWEVKEILVVRKVCSILKYCVSWVGHDKDPEWYPVSDFKYSPHKLQNFHLAHPNLLRPLYRLEN